MRDGGWLQRKERDEPGEATAVLGRVREATVMAGGSGDSGNGLKATRGGSGGYGDEETGG